MPTEPEPGREALVYDPSRVSWAVAEAVSMPPSSLARVSVYMIVLLIAGAVTYAHLTSITITVDGPGAIRTSVKIIPVKAEVAGRVAVFAVKDNQRVKKGQLLAELEDEVDGKTLAAARALVQRIDGLAADGSEPSLTDTAGVAQDVMHLEIPALVRERSALADAANALHQALRGVRDVGELSVADYRERNEDLVKIAKIRRQGLAIDLDNEVAELERAVARFNVSIRNRRDQAVQQLSSARSSLAVQVRSFEQSLDLHIKSQRVISPADGIATKVAVSGPSELVTAHQALLEIIPDGGSLIAEVQFANRDIAQLKVGMAVDLRLDALPYQDFGTLPGHILETPADATDPGSAGALPSYLVKVTLDRTSLDAGAGPRPVILGMTLQAEVQVRKRTLLELTIRQIVQLKDKI